VGLLAPETDRRIIPRWRDSRITVSTGELDGTRPKRSTWPENSAAEFEQKLRRWNVEDSIEAAAELAQAALVLGRPREARDAAEMLVLTDSEATPAVRAIAEAILSDLEGRPRRGETDPTAAESDTLLLRARIHGLKHRLIEMPRNPILWVDLSRAYSILGQHRLSKDSMSRALALAPSNRFVLRSAARLFVHLEENDRAHDLLLRARRTEVDPWLMAAEIAVAQVAERSPASLRRARDVLRSGAQAPRQVAELASAVATVGLKEGNLRRARQLFRESLVDPTENAVAQAGWASRHLPGVEVGPQLIQQAQSHEAQAIADYRGGNWSDAILECQRWLLDEAFSSRPASLGSYVAIVALQDYDLAESLARRGLVANPGDPMLLNNLVVALANKGSLGQAETEFQKIPRVSENPALRATVTATKGLLRFRQRLPEEGRGLYREALRLAAQAGSQRLHALAAVHLAREEIIAETPEAPLALHTAIEISKGLDAQEVLQMLAMLRPRQR